jgi:RNA polymerase sigma-70 factor, ECF subfamily
VEPSDEALCRLVAERDDAAFERLVDRYQARAYRLAWSVLGDAEEAKDVSQEAFLRLFERAASFDGRSKFSTWFHRLLVNLAIDRRRRRRGWLRRLLGGEDAEAALEAAPAAAADDPAALVGERELAARLWRAAERLSPQQRAALVLSTQEDMATSEIAEALDCSEATVRVHLHRAVGRLREVLKE